jgi:hypothetical protein
MVWDSTASAWPRQRAAAATTTTSSRHRAPWPQAARIRCRGPPLPLPWPGANALPHPAARPWGSRAQSVLAQVRAVVMGATAMAARMTRAPLLRCSCSPLPRFLSAPGAGLWTCASALGARGRTTSCPAARAARGWRGTSARSTRCQRWFTFRFPIRVQAGGTEVTPTRRIGSPGWPTSRTTTRLFLLPACSGGMITLYQDI